MTVSEQSSVTEARPSGAIARAADILGVLSENYRPQTLSDLGRVTGVPKSTLHGLLADLMSTGLVRRVTDGSGYLLGGRVLDLARRYLDNDLLVMNFLDAAENFVTETGQTVHLSRLDGQDVVLLGRRHGPRGLQGASSVGARFPAFSSGVGKAMLSLLDDDEIRLIYEDVDRLPAKTRQALITVDQLVGHLHNVRDMGYAIDDEESQVGLRCYGTSLFKLSGMCFGISTTITATGHSRADEDRFLMLLMGLRDELVSGSSDEHPAPNGE